MNHAVTNIKTSNTDDYCDIDHKKSIEIQSLKDSLSSAECPGIFLAYMTPPVDLKFKVP
jgi:hypothetical protein